MKRKVLHILRILEHAFAIFCGIIICLIVFWWQVNVGVSISSQTPVNANEPFSTYFTFTNNSYFVLTDLHCEYHIYCEGCVNADNIAVPVAGSWIAIHGQLLQGHSHTVQSGMSSVISLGPDVSANMTISIYWTPKFGFMPLPVRHDSFSFQSVRTGSGYAWIEKDVIKPLIP